MNFFISEQDNPALFPDSSKEEHLRRISRLREEMERCDIDGMFLTQETNVRYATGMMDVAWPIQSYFYTAFIPRSSEYPVAIFVPNGGQIQTQATWVKTIVRWNFPVGFYMGKVGESLIESFSFWINKLGLKNSRIATEMSAHFRIGISVEILDKMRASLPDIKWTDCGPVMWPVRSIKSDEEIKRLRESTKITCAGIKAGFESIKEGSSERDLANAISSTMHSEGGSDIKFLSLYAGPERALWGDGAPRREMKIKKGSLIQFDGGCTYDGYYTDIKRFACFGEPTKEQYRFYEIARSSEQAAIDAVVPGATYGEIYEASQQVIRESGYPEFVTGAQSMNWTSIGHNIGLDIHELPGISKDNKETLKPNQVICIEPFFYQDGGFPIWTVSNKYGLEDQILVTENGHEILSPDEFISRDIWIA